MPAIAQLLKNWLTASKSVRPLTVVLGNESGDLDSVVGSICLAYVLNSCPSLGFGLAVPALNFDSRDLCLRMDVHNFLRSHGVEGEELLTADPDCQSLPNFIDVAKPDVNLFLFDHNKLVDVHKTCADRVVGILDHHKNEELYKSTTSMRIIKEVGSASTLIGSLCREHNVSFPFPALLGAPIVIDCENFDLTRNRATEEDILIYKWLEESMNPKVNATELFKQLKEWRTNIFSLSVEENLRRDYKCYVGERYLIGRSSIPCSRQKFLQHYPEFGPLCLKFLTAKKVEVLFLAFAGTDNGTHQRDLIIIGCEPTIEGFLAFASNNSLFLEVEKNSIDRFMCVSFSLTDTTMSRKKLAPLIRSTL